MDFKNRIEYVNNKVSGDQVTDMIVEAIGRVHKNKVSSKVRSSIQEDEPEYDDDSVFEKDV
jgi:hypothetical protein